MNTSNSSGGGETLLLHRCKEQHRKILSARSKLAQQLGELSQIHDNLNRVDSKIQDIDQRLPLVQASMAPIRNSFALASGLTSRVDEAIARVSSVLDIFTSITSSYKKLLADDPRYDIRKYIFLVCSLERNLQLIHDAYSPSLDWLEEVVDFLRHARAVDKYSLSKLMESFVKSKSLDPRGELMKKDLLNKPLEKLEQEFGRLLAEESHVVDLMPHAKTLETRDAQSVAPFMGPDAIAKLLVISDRLRVNKRIDVILVMYNETRTRTLRKSMATLKPEYLRSATDVNSLSRLKWEDIHRHLFSWIQDFAVVVKVLMASEKELCNQVFRTMEPTERLKCFSNLVQHSNFVIFFEFPKAVACSEHRPEALMVGLLDLSKGISNAKADFYKVFDGCTEIFRELTALQRSISQNICRAFWELVKNVEAHQTPVPSDGGKDHNASFVVNYMGMIMRDYKNPIEEALTSQHSSKMLDVSLQSAMFDIMNALDKSLENRFSRMSDDPVLAHVFLMNNYRHVLVRLKDCLELAECLGESFKTKWRNKVDFHMRSYLKKAWENVLSHLNREGMHSSGSRGVSRETVKTKVLRFNAAFEETCRQHARFVILDRQLRDSVQLAIIQMLVPAYHGFIQTYGSMLEEAGPSNQRIIKYSGDALQSKVRTLFEGRQTRS